MKRVSTTRFAIALATVFAPGIAAYCQGIPGLDAQGLFEVGHRQFSLVDAGRADRNLLVDAWYPVNSADAVGELTSYHPIPGNDFAFPSLRALVSPAVSDAEPFPLLVFSHGGGSSSSQSPSFSETLASHGFIVVAPNHTGNTMSDVPGGLDLNQSEIDRPQDVSYVIDRMLDMNNSQGSAFFARIAEDKIGAAGHSFGGETALNAQFGVSRLGLSGDDRIRAVMAISSGAGNNNSDFYVREPKYDVPTFLLGGTRDWPRGQNFFPNIDAIPRYLAVIEDAGHTSYNETCERRDFAVANGAPPEVISGLTTVADDETFGACTDDNIPNDEAIRITNDYALAFFKTHLSHDESYSQVLTRDYALAHEPKVDFSAITFALQAGDADQDGDFDQLDLVRVQQSGKYLSGERASWEEGDWNGAPGGGAGYPPRGDRRFDQLDVVAAQQAGLYLTGPYAGMREDVNVPVPEPSSLLLLSVALMVMACRRCRVSIAR